MPAADELLAGRDHARLVQRLDDAAVGGDALRDLQPMAARDERLGLVPGEVEHVGHADAPDLQHVAKAARGDQPGPGARALQDGVGADCRAVQHFLDLARGNGRVPRSRASRPATTARLGSSGVVETLLSCRTPSPDMTTMSVNVPPISTATRTPACTFPDARSLQEAMQLQAIVVVKEPIISYHFVHTTCAVRRHVGLDLPATTTFGSRPAWTPGITKPTLTR